MMSLVSDRLRWLLTFGNTMNEATEVSEVTEKRL
jgi:hypothetical protein